MANFNIETLIKDLHGMADELKANIDSGSMFSPTQSFNQYCRCFEGYSIIAKADKDYCGVVAQDTLGS